MPEYLAPGVFVEEVSFRAKSIEGVSTSTTGFVGLTRYGPVLYPGGPTSNRPRMVGSFSEFERVFGGLEPFMLDGQPTLPYTAYAARAFFENGGQRLYVARVFARDANDSSGVAEAAVGDAAGTTWRARWPGRFGNVVVECEATRSDNVGSRLLTVAGDPVDRSTWGFQVRGATNGAVVEIRLADQNFNPRTEPLQQADLFVLLADPQSGRQLFRPLTGAAAPALQATDEGNGVFSFPQPVEMRVVELTVTVRAGERVDAYPRLAGHPSQRRYIGQVLEKDDPESEDAIVWLDRGAGGAGNDTDAAALIFALATDPGAPMVRRRFTLGGGNDGGQLTPDAIKGKSADPDDLSKPSWGLEALGEIDDIAIVAAPDSGSLPDDSAFVAADALVTHAETYRYRIAVVDGPQQSTMTKIRQFRGKFDSTRAALYHPWIEVLDPLSRPSSGYPQKRILLPPSGAVAGIYARSDVTRGVHKAPANEIVRGLTRFEININKARNEVLNPEGVNCLRFFEGSGNRVWGARTMTSDQEWKYVNVRRLFIYIEHSIDKATQWAVFEPNNDLLWKRIKRSVEDFLFVLWRDGALLGRTPEEAYFVACDRTTMTQNDLDNGRMICLVGISPTKPAEFVIFRVGQWTADAPM